MRKLTLIAAAMLLFCLSGQAQRQMDQKLVKQLLNLSHPTVTRDIIAPDWAEYYTNEEAILLKRDKYTYNPDEYYLEQKETEVQDLGSWYPYLLETYEYGFDENPIELLVERWENGQWTNSEHVLYSYEDYGMFTMIKEETYLKWDGSHWLNNKKFIYDYDPLITVVVKDWNGNNWENHYLYTYEDNSVLLQYWLGGAWQNQEMQTFTYTANEDIETIIYKEWTNNAWQNVQKDTYYYDAQGGIQKIVKAPWENGAWSTTNNQTVSYVLDKDGNCEHAVCEANYGGGNMLNTDIEMFYNQGESVIYPNVHEITMAYCDVTHVSETVATNSFTMVPNPVQDRFVIQGEGFVKAEVYTLSGQKVMEVGSGERSGNAIDVTEWAKGVYLVKIHGDNGVVETQKLVVR